MRALAVVWALGAAVVVVQFATEALAQNSETPGGINSDTHSGMQEHVPGTMLLRFEEGVDADAIAQEHGLELVQKVGSVGGRLYRIKDGAAPVGKAAKLRGIPGVVYAAADHIGSVRNDGPPIYLRRPLAASSTPPNDPRFPQQWHLSNIKATEAWKLTTGSDKVKLCVIDTGAIFHPDLVGNLKLGYNGDTRLNGSEDFKDLSGHGTHNAGIAAAVGNNNLGIVGVAWQANLLVCKFNQLSEAATTECLRKCWRDWGAKISSNSWGWDVPAGYNWTGPELLKAEIKAAQAGGHLFIGAVANKNVDVDSAAPAWRDYPTMWNLNNILTVASTNMGDKKRPTSSFGPISVDLAAPGDNVLSLSLTNDYVVQGGTSVAAPMVAGAAVLLRERARQLGRPLGYRGLKNRLMKTVDPIPEYMNKTVTGGRLNILAALQTLEPLKV